MCLRQAQVIIKTINHTRAYLEGMELVYAMLLIQLPALIHLLYSFILQSNHKKAIWKFIWFELTLFIISVGLHFVEHNVSH